MSEKPILVVLSPRFPYPIEKGDKLRLFHQLRALRDHFQVHLISLSDIEISQKDIRVVDKLVHENHVLRQSSNRLIKAGFKTLFGRKALQENYYKESKIQTQVERLLRLIKPDLVYVQLVRPAHMVINWKGPKAIARPRKRKHFTNVLCIGLKPKGFEMLKSSISRILIRNLLFLSQTRNIWKSRV